MNKIIFLITVIQIFVANNLNCMQHPILPENLVATILSQQDSKIIIDEIENYLNAGGDLYALFKNVATILSCAIISEKKDIVEYLINEKKFDLKKTSFNNEQWVNALPCIFHHWREISKNITIAKIIIDASPFEHFYETGYIIELMEYEELIDLFINKKNFKINDPIIIRGNSYLNYELSNFFYLAVMQKCSVELLNSLINLGANIDPEDALDLAKNQKCSKEVINFLNHLVKINNKINKKLGYLLPTIRNIIIDYCSYDFQKGARECIIM